jgi:hypothetical protein
LYPTNDRALMDSYDLDTVAKFARYEAMLRALPVGLSEWAAQHALQPTYLRWGVFRVLLAETSVRSSAQVHAPARG